MPDDESPILAALGLDTADLPAPPADLWDAALAAAFDPAATADPDTVPDMDDTVPADDELQLVVDEPDDTTALHADGPTSTTGGEDFGDASVDPAGTDDPLSEAEIQELRQEIDSLDAQILASVKRRAEVSRLIGKTRMASGGTRLVHTRELKVYERFSELGEEGRMLASLLLRLGRGRLG